MAKYRKYISNIWINTYLVKQIHLSTMILYLALSKCSFQNLLYPHCWLLIWSGFLVQDQFVPKLDSSSHNLLFYYCDASIRIEVDPDSDIQKHIMSYWTINAATNRINLLQTIIWYPRQHARRSFFKHS